MMGVLYCSFHGVVTSVIRDHEIPSCCKRHKKAGCPLSLTWRPKR